jgi:hypothetical protein
MIVCIEGIDTGIDEAFRNYGAQMGIISTTDSDPATF